MLITITLTGILIAGLSATLFLSMRSLDGSTGLAREARAGDVVAELGADVRLSRMIVQRTDDSLTVIVPDRDSPPDGKDETIRYAWQGSVGTPGPLVRQYNDGNEVAILDEVHDFTLSAGTRTATAKALPVPPIVDPSSWGYFTTVVPGAGPPAWLATGAFTGDGADDRAITGLGFTPDVVIVKGDVASRTAVIRTSTVLGDAAKSMGGGATMLADRIQSLDADGFTIGSSSDVNANGQPYFWIAFRQEPDLLQVGSYDGDGIDARSIAGRRVPARLRGRVRRERAQGVAAVLRDAGRPQLRVP